ncbi:hypothetical protein K458DRAFT_294629 [Lentithecium fluviatile CBS 122367]|uniref:CorA-like transporter domain-containing protein n=1 Tax=Lentithecium fluviatile CBS 122367 TaxID=1168545 RepID=A0A6G1JBN1_9PLEO|nr:hypothetical protein K458DRAFT_294629 [Lentithecium fluviatile CBS 122367]
MTSHRASSTRLRPWTHAKGRVLLKDGSESACLRITDISEARQALSTKPHDKAKIRIISIYSRRTLSPLDITSDLLEYIFNDYSIHQDFADVVASFGQDPNIAEGSSNNATIHTPNKMSTSLSYQIRYVEENQRGGQDPWSLRHTGIYHHRNTAANGLDVFILLHPVREPVIENQLSALEGDVAGRKELCTNPFLIHTWLFSSYFDNWRWYLRYLGTRFASENNLAMVIKPERTEPSSSFLRVQRLRNLNDFILFSRACCAGNLDLLTRLSKSSMDGWKAVGDLDSQMSKMKGYIESANVLKGRVQNLIDLVGYTLTLHNQLESAKIDTELRDLTEGLKRLTEDTVDDSATVKVITFLSAIYLPGSFIATIYGMNFFIFNPESRNLEISPDFWIFIATWLPLTLITGGIYVLILYIDSRLKRKVFRWPWQMKPRSIASLPASPSPSSPVPQKIG